MPPLIININSKTYQFNYGIRIINLLEKAMKNFEMTAVFEPCDEGGFIAYFQEIQGINTQGETIEEAKENLTDAVNLVFEEMRASNMKGKAKKMITQTMSFSF
jgi:predicted RNase H-like HicB family nuclease